LFFVLAEDAKPEPVEEEPVVEELPSMEEIQAAMGFEGFGTTPGKEVKDKGSNIGRAQVSSKRRFRQYINRRGGYNQPLARTF
jgi:U4/U6.U5 tri-snRNP-associated protein 3